MPADQENANSSGETLSSDGGPGDASDTPVQDDDEEDIENDVGAVQQQLEHEYGLSPLVSQQVT